MTQINFGKDRYHEIQDMESWCRDNIGAGGWVYADPGDWAAERKWAMSSAFGNTTFYFRDASDATAFTLKWV